MPGFIGNDKLHPYGKKALSMFVFRKQGIYMIERVLKSLAHTRVDCLATAKDVAH